MAEGLCKGGESTATDPFEADAFSLHRDECPTSGTFIPVRRPSWDKPPDTIGTLSHDKRRSSHVPLKQRPETIEGRDQAGPR